MPVTAKLSRQFYDRFGDEITNELVDWFNQVDATYRNDLRELNELNFQRFDAKLEQRIADVRSEMHVGFAKVDARFDRLESRLETQSTELTNQLETQSADLTNRLEARSTKLANRLETRSTALENQLESRCSKLESQMETRFAQQRGYLEERLGAQMKWMFGFWLGTLIPLAGLMIALQGWGG